MFVMDVPYIPAQEAPLILADASISQNSAPQYDRVIGVCHLTAGSMVLNKDDSGAMSVADEAVWYLENKMHLKVTGRPTVSILNMPTHGTLDGPVNGAYAYLPEEGYLGNDRATLLVEVGGKKVRLEYFFRVMKSIPIENDLVDPYRDNCPKKVRVWKISSTTDSNGNTILAADVGSTVVPIASEQRYDAAFSVCQAVVPTSHRDFALANVLHPVAAIGGYLFRKGISLDSNAPIQVTVVDNPAHGKLMPDVDFPNSVFVYYRNDGYLGPDQITFVVEMMGKKFKVIETVWVSSSPPEYGGCPEDYKLPPATTGNEKGSALDVIEPTITGQARIAN